MLVDKFDRGLVRRRVELLHRLADEVAHALYVAAAVYAHIEKAHIVRTTLPRHELFVLRHVVHHNVVRDASYAAQRIQQVTHISVHRLGQIAVYDHTSVAILIRR